MFPIRAKLSGFLRALKNTSFPREITHKPKIKTRIIVYITVNDFTRHIKPYAFGGDFRTNTQIAAQKTFLLIAKRGEFPDGKFKKSFIVIRIRSVVFIYQFPKPFIICCSIYGRFGRKKQKRKFSYHTRDVFANCFPFADFRKINPDGA